jgi:YHS domain-containing protein
MNETLAFYIYFCEKERKEKFLDHWTKVTSSKM